MSIASLVLGLVWLGGLGSLLAVIFGSVARKQIHGSGGRQSGKGMAGWGIALGIIGLVGAAIGIALFIVAVHRVDACNNSGGSYINGTCVHPSGSGNTGSSRNSGSGNSSNSGSGNSGTGNSGNSG